MVEGEVRLRLIQRGAVDFSQALLPVAWLLLISSRDMSSLAPRPLPTACFLLPVRVCVRVCACACVYPLLGHSLFLSPTVLSLLCLSFISPLQPSFVSVLPLSPLSLSLKSSLLFLFTSSPFIFRLGWLESTALEARLLLLVASAAHHKLD